MAVKADAISSSAKLNAPAKENEAKKIRREVSGNFSYSNTPTKFKETLDGLIRAERPDKFNRDFVETVLNVKGGSVTAYPPILKRLGFLAQDNSPTELYGQFQTASGRSEAAFQALKNGFGELFKRNAHVHKADDQKVRDYLIQITGRTKDDPVVSSILGTFNAVKAFITSEVTGASQTNSDNEFERQAPPPPGAGISSQALGLSYHINLVIPETSDIAVLNAIFRSLRENLLRD